MFGVFRSKVISDAELGELRRSGKYWKGHLALDPCGTFRLVLVGDREKPHPISLQLAKQLPSRFASLMPDIQRSLFEHYVPYREVLAVGPKTGSHCPNIAKPEEVWSHVTSVHAVVDPLNANWTVETAFRVAWDLEHTVGARFQNWKFTELNGSV